MVEKSRIILELKELAKEVRELKAQSRPKRPIVIEFSGSPKSGKTSSINSLEIFLKRNGFRVEVIQERASICPVGDKQSPMFNVWTACTSISSMLGVLEAKIINTDVLILDRGIFDALCWFDWLSNKELLNSGLKENIEKFLLIKEFITRIDIIFAFTVDPEKSIEREYANLLTDIRGSIMNENTLKEYHNSIKNAITKYSKNFHNKIQEIDTTEKTQQNTGKYIIEQTLNVLKDLLIEKIGYISFTESEIENISSRSFWDLSSLPNLSLKTIKFDNRPEVEENNEYIQILPILVLTNKDHTKILMVRKKETGKDSVESKRPLLYVGGHTRKEDSLNDVFWETCKNALTREIKEELGLSISIDNIIPAVIYTPVSEKSKKHIAVCYLKEIEDTENIALKLDSYELVQKSGKSDSGTFILIEDIHKYNNKGKGFEPWSKEILKNLFKIDLQELI